MRDIEMRADLSVLIDARKLGHGGIGVYLRNLISGLIELKAAGAPLSISILKQPGTLTPFYKEVIEYEEKAGLYSLSELFGLGRRISALNVDIFHSPHFTLPFGISVPTVATIHDLIHINSPERWYYPYIASPLVKSAARRATKVVTVSEATKAELLSLMGNSSIIRGKMVVIPNSLDESVIGAARPMGELRRELHLYHPFVLAVVSTSKPHKGLNDLLRAWKEVRLWDTTCDLVVVGEGVESSLHFQREEGIRVLGKVSDSVLYSLYKSCHLLAIPSLAEGFCLPALEAKRCGARLVTRPVPALKELVGPSDVVSRDFSIASFTQALLSGIRSGLVSAEPPYDFERFQLSRVSEQMFHLYCEIAKRPQTSFASAVDSPLAVSNSPLSQQEVR